MQDTKNNNASIKRILSLCLVLLMVISIIHVPASAISEDAAFFQMFNLDYPGLEAVKAAVESNDYATAKAELVSYYRNRTNPNYEPGRRSVDKPGVSDMNKLGGKYTSSLTIDFEGWKQVEIPFSSLTPADDPVGFNKIDKIGFYAQDLSDTATSLRIDDISVSNGSKTLIVDDFEDKSQNNWLTTITAQSGERATVSFITETNPAKVKSGSYSGTWERFDVMSCVENSVFPHNWDEYDTLKLWIYSEAITNSVIDIELTSSFDEASIKIADDILEGFLIKEDLTWDVHSAAPEKYIDWSKVHYISIEVTYTLNRHLHWQWLANAYWETNDEKYAEEISLQMKDWIKNCPVPTAELPGDVKLQHPTWRTLEAGIRMFTWHEVMLRVIDSPSIDDETILEYLQSIYEHCNYLTLFPSAVPNWLTTESVGLATSAMLFPEFNYSGIWFDSAIDRMSGELEKSIYPDGSHAELAMMYAIGAPNSYFIVSRLASIIGVTVPDSFITQIERAYEYFMSVIKPNGSLPQTNDSDSAPQYATQYVMLPPANLFGRQDFIYSVYDGKIGTKPNAASVAKEYAGHYVMRSDWDSRDARYMMIDAGPYGDAGHQHEDFLSFELSAFDRDLIVDSGRYTYTMNEWRNYFKGTKSHSSVVVDGLDQSRRDNTHYDLNKKSPVRNTFVTSDNFDFFNGSYIWGYGEHWTSSTTCNALVYDVTHDRSVVSVGSDYWIVLDRMTSDNNTSHKYEQMFQLNSINTAIDNLTKRLSSSDAGAANLHIIPSTNDVDVKALSGQQSPIYGWYSTTDNAKTPITSVIYTKTAANTAFETVLYPVRADDAEIPAVTSADVLENETVLNKLVASAVEVATSRGTDIIYQAANPGHDVSYGEYDFDGTMSIVRRSSSDDITSISAQNASTLTCADEILFSVTKNSRPVKIGRVDITNPLGTAVEISCDETYSGKMTLLAPAASTVTLNGSSVSFVRNGDYITVELSGQTGETMYNSSVAVPMAIGVASLNLGTKFSPNVDGVITAIRAFGVQGESGVHIAAIWEGDQMIGGPYNFDYTGKNRWEELPLPAPVAVEKNKEYIVSVSVGQDAKSFCPAGMRLNAGNNGLNISYPEKYSQFSFSKNTAPNTENTVDFFRDIVFVKSEDAEVAVTGVTLNKSAIALQATQTEQLTATVIPNEATNKAVSWASDNTSVATVSADGLVTAVSPGTANITVTTSSGGFTAPCQVVVSAQTNRSDDAPPSGQTIPAVDGEVAVSYTQKGKTVTLDLPASKVEEIIKAAEGGTAIFDISGVKDAGEAVVPQAALKTLSEAGLEVEIKLPEGAVTLDGGTLATAVASGGNVTVSLTEVKAETLTSAQKEQLKPGDVVIDISLMAGTTVIHELNGTVTITIPYDGELPVAVWYLNGAGKLEKLKCSYSGGFVTFTTDHLSLYVLGQDTAWQNPFTDVAESAWYYDAVRYVYENGVMQGTGSSLFAPGTTVNRAMMVQILYNIDGRPASGNALFDDVSGTAWYADAVAWAAENGIVKGIGNNLFAPDAAITREQMAVMLYNYCVFKGTTLPLLREDGAFADADRISSWAVESTEKMYKAKVLNGKGEDMFDPQGTATRAEVASMLYVFLETIK